MIPGSARRRARPKSVTQMLPLRIDQQVGGLDVAMDDALLVRMRQCIRRFAGRPWRPSGNKPAREEDRTEAARARAADGRDRCEVKLRGAGALPEGRRLGESAAGIRHRAMPFPRKLSNHRLAE